jgi:hypothetical protein
MLEGKQAHGENPGRERSGKRGDKVFYFLRIEEFVFC